MDFKAYFRALTEQQREQYALEAGTTAYYIQTHLVHAYKTPKKALIKGLAQASQGAFSEEDLLLWFHHNSKH